MSDSEAELSISLVPVKEEPIETENHEEIIKNVLNEHDYIVIKKETDFENNNDDEDFGEEEEEEEEEEELIDFEEDDTDKIQAARALAELSIHPVRMKDSQSQSRLMLPDLRRTLNTGHVPGLGGGDLARFNCNICGKQYSTSSNLARHRQTHRSPDHSKARKCHLCNKVRLATEKRNIYIYIHIFSGLCINASIFYAYENPYCRT